MKFAMIFLVAVAAVAPPKISLNLEGMTRAYKLKNSIVRNTDYKQPNGAKVLSRQDWTEKCPALRHCPNEAGCWSEEQWEYTSRRNCPFPIAKAYDHQDKHVDVQTRVFLVDEDGDPVKKSVDLGDVKFDKRATYLMKFDAKDAAGNKAEQVVFALILDDLQAPFFTKGCHEKAITVEAVSDWKPCVQTGYDNVDKKIKVDYKVDYLTMGSSKGYGNYKSLKNYFGSLNKLGKYLITTRLTDYSGIYGVATDASGNTRTRVQAVLIRDTKVPTLYLRGSDPTYVECHKFKSLDGINLKYTNSYRKWGYQSPRSVCKDKLDTVALGNFLPTTTTLGAVVNVVATKKAPTWSPALANAVRTIDYRQGEQVTQRSIDYTCHDNSGNAAAARSRVIKTVDTQAPTLTLLGDKGQTLDSDTHIVLYEHGIDGQLDDPGAKAEDSCDPSVSDKKINKSWGGRPFNKNVLGDYVRTYSVTDKGGNTAVKTRTFTVVDKAEPKVEIIGPQIETLEATRDLEYTDKGATCQDMVDGDISHAIEVSGEVINRRIPGTYKVAYNCQDLSGNAAEPQYRTVIVRDTTDPKLSLIGTQITYVESGFAYKDAGATATDSLDGDITQYIWTDGNTVNTAKAWYSSRSCQEILNAWKQEKTHELSSGKEYPENGEYYITVQSKNENGDPYFKRQAVHCIFNKLWKGTALTYKIHHEGDAENCERLGMVKLSTIDGKTKIRGTDYKVKKVIKQYITRLEDHLLIGNLDEYVCVPNVVAAPVAPRRWQSESSAQLANQIQDAEQGKYVIQFNVEDKAGRRAKVVKRTVIVKDTLPPVITLHLKGKLVHTSDQSKRGISHDRIGGIYKQGSNPQPNTKGWNPYKQNSDGTIGGEYMAESATTNGWLIGAVASAVAGVALLGLSAKKTATSVPV